MPQERHTPPAVVDRATPAAQQFHRSTSGSGLQRRLRPHARLDARTYFLVVDSVTRLVERDRASSPCDADAVIDIALRRAEAGRSSVVCEDRYEAWVSVVCRNAYLNFIRSRQDRRPLVDHDAVERPGLSADAFHDGAVIEKAVLAAIDRLPQFLREVARLRFVEQCSHTTISRRTGKAPPITRAYANKAAVRLRRDSGLTRLAREWRG